MRSENVKESIENPAKVGLVLRQLNIARRQFFQSLRGMKKLNKFVISRMITFSVIITLAGNIIFTTECFVGDMNIFMQIYLPLISGFQLVLFLSFIDFLASQTKKFYRPGKFYLKAYATIGMHSKVGNFRGMFTLARFMEDIFPRRSWTFTFGPMGRISRKYLVGCLSVYVTLFLYLTPHVLK